MADNDVQALIAELSLNTRRIQAQQTRLLRSFDRTMGDMEKSGSKRLTGIEKRAEDMSRNVRRAILAIGVGVAGREVLEYEAAWRNTTNTLKQYTDVLGPAQQSASALNAIANDARAPLEELSGLTGAAARSARDLGKSGADVLIFGEAAAKGARLANTGQAAVAGAFTQLSQAIASPRVQLQEFNSIIEGTPRLAQAFADGVDGAGGSVAKLRKLIADGDVSGGDLFDALISQAGKLKEEFSTLDQGPGEAVTRLRNKLIEFVGTNETVKAGTEGLVTLIDLAADNLDILTEAVIVGTAALAGFYGAQGLLAVATGLNGVAVGATAGAKAMTILRAASAFMLGPVGLAVGAAAAAAAIALIAINASKTETPLEISDKKLKGMRDRLEQLRALQPEPFEGMKKGAEGLSDALDPIPEKFRKIIEEMEKSGKAARQAEIDSATIGIIEATENLAEAESNIAKLESALGSVMKMGPGAEGGIAGIKDQLGQARKDAEEIRSTIAELQAGRAILLRGNDADFKPDPPKPPAQGEPDKDALAKLEEIREAYRQTYQTEREAITKVRDDRLAAIDAAKIGQAEADALRQQANDVYLAQIEELEVAQLNADNAEYQSISDKVQAEKDALAEIQAARDETHGRMARLLESEYQQERELAAKKFTDKVMLAEALLALDEDYAERRRQLEDEVLGKGKFSESEVDQIRAREEEKLEALEEWYEINLEREQEYLDRRLEINAEAEAAITAIKQEAVAAQLDAASKGFDAAADLAKRFAGENSAIYKAMFLAEKAAALGSAYVQMNLAVAKAAAAAPPPANVPLITAAKVTGLATIAGIAASAISGFKDGVVDFRGKGGPRSDSNTVRISAGESVITADGTRKNSDLLRLMNDGVDIESMLARAGQPMEINPAIFAGGGRGISLGGSSLNFYGPVDQATVPQIDLALSQRNRELADTVEKIIAMDRTRTTPRHMRNNFLKG